MKETEIRIAGLDEIDHCIINTLRKNARATFSEIGQEAGISRVSAKNRVTQLEKSGIIKGYHADLDPMAVPKGIRFTLDIETDPKEYWGVVEILLNSHMLQEIYGASGACHIHAMGVAPNSETLGTNANYLYRTTKGIRKLTWQILVTTYKERGVVNEKYQNHRYM